MDIEKRIKEFHDAYGGKEAFQKEHDKRSNEMDSAWGSDIISIGLVLRSHLFVEYYLNKYLEIALKLKDRNIKTLTFRTKVARLKGTQLKDLIPSLEKFNQVRNKMSHNISASIRKESILSLLNYEGFQSHYFILQTESKELHQIYETYAKLVGQKVNEVLDPHYSIQDTLMKDVSKEVARIYREG